MQLEHVGQWAAARQRLLVYSLGSGLVTIWTLLRFFTQQTIFDLVSQQVVVHQWLQGVVTPAHMGQTAYVLKMLLLYVPLDLLPGSPRLKLILITIAINVATFVLLGLVAEKILQEFGIRTRQMFYAALLWVAVIAGSVFWIEFANSRNLEVVGGMYWVYLCLRYLRKPNVALAIGMVAFGGVLFFEDPLQLYMIATPMLLYAGIVAARKRQYRRAGTALLGITTGAYLLARLLFIVAGQVLKLSFTDTGQASAPPLSLAWLAHSLVGLAQASVSLFSGAADAGHFRMITNISILAVILTAVVYTFVRQLVPQRLILLGACVTIVDALVYIASGQAVQGAATSRYLIMLAPILILTTAAVPIPRRWRLPIGATAAVLMAFNMAVLSMSLGTHWNTSFPRDAHLESVYRYLRSHPTPYAYASIDTSMPVLYFHTVPAEQLLPIGCLAGRAVQTHFSMNTTFRESPGSPGAPAAIILDGSTIANAPNVCTAATLAKQFGPPSAVQRTDDGSLVMLYTQSQISLQ